MATDLCVQYNVGSSLKMNQDGVDTLVPRQIIGLDGRPIRRTIRPKGAGDGGIAGIAAKFGARIIRVSGDIVIVDPLNPADVMNPMDNLTSYQTKVNTLSNTWRTGLEALLNVSFTLSWTPTGVSGRTLTCYYGVESGEWQTEPPETLTEPTKFTFSLVSFGD